MSNFKFKFIYILLQLIINNINAQNQNCSGASQCISVLDCAPVLSLIRGGNLSAKQTDDIRNLHCGFVPNSKTPRVCCPHKLKPANPVENKPEIDIKVDVVTNPPSAPASLLPSRTICGKHEVGERIVGGELTDLTEFPWIALLAYEDDKGKIKYNCAGTLINNRYVLTAAHCIKNIPSPMKLKHVRLGEYRISEEEDCEESVAVEYCADPPLDLNIEEQIPHALYSSRKKDHPHDIALLRLNQTVTYTDFIRPICLPTAMEDRNYADKRTNMTVSGWGLTENGLASDIKLKAKVPFVSTAECFSIYENRLKVKLHAPNQICAGGSPGKDSCQGDSGGPLLISTQSKTDEQWVLIGIVSFGVGCGHGGFPGVYTNVSSYHQWLIDNMRP